MTYKVVISKEADAVLAKWKKSNKPFYKKTDNILEELRLHPTTGVGHPEPLVNGGGTLYSRRISANDHIIYSINNDIITVVVLTIGGHYGDK